MKYGKLIQSRECLCLKLNFSIHSYFYISVVLYPYLNGIYLIGSFVIGKNTLGCELRPAAYPCHNTIILMTYIVSIVGEHFHFLSYFHTRQLHRCYICTQKHIIDVGNLEKRFTGNSKLTLLGIFLEHSTGNGNRNMGHRTKRIK